jgi:hypothetical protein
MLSQNKVSTEINFQARPIADTFQKETAQKVSFSAGPLANIFKQVPQTEKLISEIVQGNIGALDTLNKKIEQAKTKGQVNQKEIDILNRHIAVALYDNAINEYKPGKGVLLTKLNLLKLIVVEKLNAWSKLKHLDNASFFKNRRQYPQEHRIENATNLINDALHSPDPITKEQAYNQVKGQLIDAIQHPESDINSKLLAVEMLKEYNMLSTKEDRAVISEITQSIDIPQIVKIALSK